MPLARLERARLTLPFDYRYGDAKPQTPFQSLLKEIDIEGFWKREIERSCLQMQDRMKQLVAAETGWNVIEGDHFTTGRDHGDESV